MMDVEAIGTKDLTGRLFADKQKTEVTVYRETMVNAKTGGPLVHEGYNERDALREGIVQGRVLGELGQRSLRSAKHIGHVFVTPTKKGARLVPMTNDQVRIIGALIGTLRGSVGDPSDMVAKWAEVMNSLMHAAGPLPLDWGKDDLYAALGKWWKENRDKHVEWLTQSLRAALSAMVWDAAQDDMPEETATPEKNADAQRFNAKDMRVAKKGGVFTATFAGKRPFVFTYDTLSMEECAALRSVLDCILDVGEYRVADGFPETTLDSYARDLNEKFRNTLPLKLKDRKGRAFRRKGQSVVPIFEIFHPQDSSRPRTGSTGYDDSRNDAAVRAHALEYASRTRTKM